MSIARIDLLNPSGTTSKLFAQRNLERGSITYISLKMDQMGSAPTSCWCNLFLTEGGSGDDGAVLWFYHGSLWPQSNGFWSGHYKIEGWETVILDCQASAPFNVHGLITIDYLPL